MTNPTEQPPTKLHPDLYPIMQAVQAALAAAAFESDPDHLLLRDIQPRDRRRLAALAVSIAARMVTMHLGARVLEMRDTLRALPESTVLTGPEVDPGYLLGLEIAAGVIGQYATTPTDTSTWEIAAPALAAAASPRTTPVVGADTPPSPQPERVTTTAEESR